MRPRTSQGKPNDKDHQDHTSSDVTRRPIVGYSWIVLAAVGTGFLSFGLWVHHMFTTGLPQISLAFFSAVRRAWV